MLDTSIIVAVIIELEPITDVELATPLTVVNKLRVIELLIGPGSNDETDVELAANVVM